MSNTELHLHRLINEKLSEISQKFSEIIDIIETDKISVPSHLMSYLVEMKRISMKNLYENTTTCKDSGIVFDKSGRNIDFI